MDVIFHETESFFVNPRLQGKRNLEVIEAEDESTLESLPLSLQGAQGANGEITNEIKEEAHNKAEKEKRFFGTIYWRKKKPTLVPKQEELSNPKMSAPKGNTKVVRVNHNIPIALRKEKRSCVKYLILNMSPVTISLTSIKVLLLPLMKQKHHQLQFKKLSDERWDQAIKEEMRAFDRGLKKGGLRLH